jgi:hypothetical protein
VLPCDIQGFVYLNHVDFRREHNYPVDFSRPCEPSIGSTVHVRCTCGFSTRTLPADDTASTPARVATRTSNIHLAGQAHVISETVGHPWRGLIGLQHVVPQTAEGSQQMEFSKHSSKALGQHRSPQMRTAGPSGQQVPFVGPCAMV